MQLIKTLLIISFIIIAFAFGWNNLFVSEQKKEVTSFTSIYTSGPINVYIEHEEEESLIVRGDNNIHDSVVSEVVNGELKIYTNRQIRHERVLDVYVSYKTLNRVHASGQSTLTSRGLITTSKLKIHASVSAEVKIQMDVDSLDLIMDDHANVQLAGKANRFDLLITDVGDLMAYNLISQHCKAILDTGDQSPGVARINAEQTIDVTISGPRHIKYKGDARVISQVINTSGKLLKN